MGPAGRAGLESSSALNDDRIQLGWITLQHHGRGRPGHRVHQKGNVISRALPAGAYRRAATETSTDESIAAPVIGTTIVIITIHTWLIPPSKTAARAVRVERKLRLVSPVQLVSNDRDSVVRCARRDH
jgi:hypothetical protein